MIFLLVFALALAENRPNDNDIFGATTPPPQDAFQAGTAKDNALSIGGAYYQRLLTAFPESTSISNSTLSLPLQFDGFFDARPNDRLRGFVDARLLYDPTSNNHFQSSTLSAAGTSSTTGGTSQVVLDQAWLKFDVGRALFLTLGKQHVKWGTSRFWNATDLLHTQTRDPFTTTDLRLGNSMLKVALPWEKTGTNFYGYALFDNPESATKIGQSGGAFRAETVLGKGEVGVEFLARGRRGPVYGADISTGLGPFDVYAEAACITEPGVSRSLSSPLTPGLDISIVAATSARPNPAFQASGGITYSFGWRENRLATVGAEYFYNELGYNDETVYPLLIFYGESRPFDLWRHYAGVFITSAGPDSGKATQFTLSTLGNLSDKSYYSRFDFSWRILNYLTFESFFGVHYGTADGEFRFGMNTPALIYQGAPLPPIVVARSSFDLGFGFRMSF